jgi:fructokinase
MIVVSGEALIDLIVGADGSVTPLPGGGPYNTARTIARLGGAVRFLGRVSDDEHGRAIRSALERDGVGTDLLAATSDPTTVVRAEIDGAGVARYAFELEGTSAPGLTWSQAEQALAPPPRALHVGTLGLTVEPIAASLARLVATAPADTLVMIDANCRPGAVPDRMRYVQRLTTAMRRADVVKVSAEDLAYLALAPGEEAAAVGLIRDGARCVLLTRGPDAVSVYHRRGAFDVPVPRFEVVDTVGAGDAFGGAFLARWLERDLGRDALDDVAALHDAASFAVRVATLTCQRVGADPPTRTELG